MTKIAVRLPEPKKEYTEEEAFQIIKFPNKKEKRMFYSKDRPMIEKIYKKEEEQK